jgi:hypothetical protein
MGKGAGNCFSSAPDQPASAPKPTATVAPAPKPVPVAQKLVSSGNMVKIAVIYYSSECA